MTSNGTVYFRGTDAAGNVSEVARYDVTNIDKTAPEAPTASADITAPTNSNVTVTATFSDDSTVKEYSLDGQTWSAYTDGIVMTANGTVYFRGTDAVGNVSDVATYVVTNIDKTAPEAPVTVANTTAPTNNDVTVSATFSGDTAVKQYSLDGEQWKTYTTGIVFMENGTAYFRGFDAVGNVSEVASCDVTNIDKVAPEAPSASADITTLTNLDVTLTASFSGDTAVKQYSFDGKTWAEYTKSIVMSDNGTVYFRGIDAAGNVSDVATYAVTNIDKVAPGAPIATADIMTLTNQSVTVTAVFSGDTAVKQYSLDGKTWNAYTQGVVMTENGTVYFRGMDAAGNSSIVVSYDVTNIEKVAPEAPKVTASTTDLTNRDVTVTALFSSDSVVCQFSLDNMSWATYIEPVVMSENGTVWFRGIDEAGNVSDVATYVVTNIDKVAPTKPVASADVTDVTNQNVTVTASFDGDAESRQYSFDGENWKAYTKGVVMYSNGTVYFRGVDAAGNVSTIASYEVCNIDKTAPETPSAFVDVTMLTHEDVTVTATFDCETVVKQYSLDGEQWSTYTKPVVMTENGTVFFRGIDMAGNVSDVAKYEVTNIDKIAPEKPTVKANLTKPTNRNVTVLATFDKESAVKQYSFDGKTWGVYTKSIVMSSNGMVYFRGIDAAGNVSEVASYEVTNIDKVAPRISEFTVSEPIAPGLATISLTPSEEPALLQFSWNGGRWEEMSGQVLEVASNGTLRFRLVDAAGNETVTNEYRIDVFDKAVTAIEQRVTDEGNVIVDWSGDATVAWSQQFDVNLATKAGVIGLAGLSDDGVELLNAPTANYTVSLKPCQSELWSYDGALTVHNDGVASVINAEGNGLVDVMFATKTTVWDGNYQARHVGVDGWEGTGQTASLEGKNVIGDVFSGSEDASILLLTDDANGDALFVDDIYSGLPDALDAQQSRLANINEIRAGAGDDIVDLTSQRFAFVGDGMTVRGGLGDDVIWANKGDNLLFGDAGNDSIVGASGNDVLVGGADDDTLHGGGGDDIFVFGGDWGHDTVEQLADGKVTLWFDEGDATKWNASTLTYTDGDKSVKVTGVADVSLKFGNDGSEEYADLLAAGAFDELTSEKVFEDRNKGMLA